MAKSWGKTKKRLENDLLCKKLRGKIQYFYTEYRYLNNDFTARFAIRFNHEEIFCSSTYYYDDFWREQGNVMKYIKESDYFSCDENGNIVDNKGWRAWNEKVKEIALKNVIEKGQIPVYYFIEYFEEFFHTSIHDAINSDNPVLRMLAIFDRRVGIRTLEKIALNLSKEPEWLQKIYKVRLDAEGIKYDTN